MKVTDPYYFSLIRKYVVTMGSLFDDIFIKREDANNDIQTIKIPVTYAPKEKVLARFNQDPPIAKLDAIELPRISFAMDSLFYDTTRKLPSINRLDFSSNTGTKSYQYVPVPYDFNFKVWVYVKNLEDGNKIVEQILPYFSPDWTVSAELIPGLPNVDIPIILKNVGTTDIYEGDFKERKIFMWELAFTLKGNLYGPVKQKGIIKYSNVNMYSYIDGVNLAKNKKEVTITTQPGLTANGQPTSNASLSIPYMNININDDYGYISTITEF